MNEYNIFVIVETNLRRLVVSVILTIGSHSYHTL